MNIRKKALLALSFVIFPWAAHAADHVLVAPECLIKAAALTPAVLARQDSLVVIKADKKTLRLLSAAKHHQPSPCGGYFDITDEWNGDAAILSSFAATPVKASLGKSNYAIHYEKQANQLIAALNPQLMWSNLSTFSNFQDRYADSDTGVAATKWIGEQIKMAVALANRDDVTVTYLPTKGYQQPSVIVKVGKSDEAGVVIGAHLDTTESVSGPMPGADDDGSGSMTVLESARTVIVSGMKFSKPIYYIWYSAEEEGMKGSQAVVKHFKSEKIKVAGVMQFDMTGYAYKNKPDIWVFDDFTDKELSKFLSDIITTYTKRPIQHSRCGYACSDHVSWNLAGFKAVLPAESRFQDTNEAAHTSKDTMDKLSLTHMTDYTKIATAFAVEMAEPIDGK